MRRLYVLLGLALFSLSACHGEHSHDDGEQFICDGTETPYTAGTIKAGDGGIFKLEIALASPNPHTVDINTLRVKILDAQDQLVTGAMLTRIEPFAAKHDHGTPIAAEWAPVTGMDGYYDITNINYVHRGPWNLFIDIKKDAAEDTVLFTFCIDNPNLPDAGV